MPCAVSIRWNPVPPDSRNPSVMRTRTSSTHPNGPREAFLAGALLSGVSAMGPLRGRCCGRRPDHGCLRREGSSPRARGARQL